MKRTTVLLLFGGESSEHDVSISSARNVRDAIDVAKYEVIVCFIDRQGKWWLVDSLDDKHKTQGAAVQLVPVLGSNKFITIPNSNQVVPDVIFPVLHGKNGEDGSIQGLAQLLHIPIVGCDMTASAICMNKLTAKQILSTYDIKNASYVVNHSCDTLPDFDKLKNELGCPMFVKPARAGSSVGVSRVNNKQELVAALDLAHQHDDIVLIEQGIVGRELEVAVLGNPPNHKASGVGEIKLGDDFYSYDEKYAQNSGAQTITDAELNTQTVDRIRLLAERTYQVLGCKGLARIDFFLTNAGELYINEVNTMPGFTNISMYPKLWQAQGLDYANLIDRLIRLATDDTILSTN